MAKPKRLSDLPGYTDLFPERVTLDELVGKEITINGGETTTTNHKQYGENEVVIISINVTGDDKDYEVMTGAWRVKKAIKACIELNFFPFTCYVGREGREFFLSDTAEEPF